MDLTERQRKHLRKLAHDLNPVIHIGDAGLTDPVTQETDRALRDHELIKVKVRGAGREACDDMLDELAQRTGSTLVQRIGHVAVLYRANPGVSKIIIPDA